MNEYVICEDGRIVKYEIWLEEQKNKWILNLKGKGTTPLLFLF